MLPSPLWVLEVVELITLQLFFMLPHGVSSYMRFSAEQQVQVDNYSDFWRHFLQNSLFSSTLSCKFHPPPPPQTLISVVSIQWEYCTLSELSFPVPWPTKDFQVIVTRALAGLAKFIFLFPGLQSLTAYCPISENSCFICISNFSNFYSKGQIQH